MFQTEDPVKVAKDLRLPQFTLEMVSAKRCADKIHMGKHWAP